MLASWNNEPRAALLKYTVMPTCLSLYLCWLACWLFDSPNERKKRCCNPCATIEWERHTCC
uniref:Uncharacterized protein n=1 Tax=Picea glauca TaxID=3330 RepID=A0A117NHX3_PICGL|nr:hypothetical protein ABT39_MTgene4347 [Picea glauca]